jgi:hypothetical protein
MSKKNRNGPVWVLKGRDWVCMDSNKLLDYAFNEGLGMDTGWDMYSCQATTPCGMARAYSNHMDMTWCPSKPLKKGDSHYYPDLSKIRR